MKISKYILFTVSLLILSACDTDLVPRGQSVLGTVQELEYLLNAPYVSTYPYADLSIVVNESYGRGTTTVKNQLKNTETLAPAYLTYDESVDRHRLCYNDDRYTSIYKNINNYNIIINKIDAATGSDRDKARVKAEATLLRAYMYYLAATIYARQYDESYAANTGGIVYSDNYDVSYKLQLPLGDIWNKILDDCKDEYIALLPDDASFNRCTRATGNAIKAKVLFQMKRYSDALPYAQEAIRLNPNIEDRRKINDTGQWKHTYEDPSNMIFIGTTGASPAAVPVYEQLSIETAGSFEPGDMVKDYACTYANTTPYYGNPNYMFWSPSYGRVYSGINGSLICATGSVYLNPWGITVERMMYLAAECMIRADMITDGMNIINDIREKRIHPDSYSPFSASSKAEAMEVLQKVKFIENIGSYENFFDHKRWNSETDYRKTITRDLGDLGTFSVSPESSLWIMPIPTQVFINNPNVKPNF